MSDFTDAALWGALLQIIGINIVLSGDNAVVIALAARSLPPKQQQQAVLWGSGAAVAMRIGLTIVAVELLRLRAYRSGHPSQVIAQYAKEKRCQQIFMSEHAGTAGEGLLGSVATEVVRLSDVPVVLV